MSWINVAVVGGGLLSSYMGGQAAQSAASTAADAQIQAAQIQQQMFNQTQSNLQPFMQSGQGSLQQLVQGTQPGGNLTIQPYQQFGINQFNASPEAQLLQNQDTQMLNASQNASSISGGSNSNNLQGLIASSQAGAMGQYNNALNNYLQQYLTGNNATQQQFNNLQTMAGSSQNAAAGLGALSGNVAGNIGQNIVGAGTAQAAGQVGSANALTNGINTGYNTYLQQQYLSAMNPSVVNNGMSYSNPGVSNYQTMVESNGFSDRALKTDILRMGETVLGLGLYTWNYVWDASRRYQGVMADEVRKVMPEAVTKGTIKGKEFDRVNYAMLGIEMVEV